MERGTIKYYGEYPIWKNILAALFYTWGLVCIYHSIFTPPKPGGENNPGNIILWLFYAFFCFGIGWHFFMKITNFEIDLSNQRFRISQRYFKLKVLGWRYFNYPDHVSITKVSSQYIKVKIWYYRKRRTMVIEFDDYDSALTFAKQAAICLDTKLREQSATGKNYTEISLKNTNST